MLNRLTDAARTPVSVDGKMLSKTVLPTESPEIGSLKPNLMTLKPGALVPGASKLPTMFTGVPCKYIGAMELL